MVIKLYFNSVTGRFNLNIFLAGGVSPWRPVRLEALSWRAVLLEAFSWRVVRLEAPEKFDNWRNVLLEKCPPWRRVLPEACPPGGVSSRRRVLLEACPPGGLSAGEMTANRYHLMYTIPIPKIEQIANE